ncbi:acyltransferase family protein [uncultured Aquimarina sp.]|uniref:acyltransferase family protein n=1 Tax=uncultured Aquimarina sp. TaxID=575652 RepID=UPI00260E54F3|nr:acyltransferase family protein [uncultured Aquimarina sp.]
MDQAVSNKIRILSFFSIFMVVVCHAYNLTGLSIETNRNVAYYIEYLFALELSNIFIPMFFFISGYLFFKNHDLTVSTFKRKIRNRFKSLVIPYVLWCALWFLIVYAIQFIPILSGFFEQPLHQMPAWRQAWLAFVDPINYTFWFIRELIFYIWITPFIYLGIRYLKFFFLVFLFALLFLKQPSLFFINKIYLFQFLGLFSFSCGAYTSISKFNIISNFKNSTYIYSLLFWAVLIICNFYVRDAYAEGYWVSILCKRITMFVGFFTVWTWYDFINSKYEFRNKQLYGYRFFIYAAHGVALTYFTKIYVKYIGENDLILLIFFFVSPILATLVCVGFAKLLHKQVPKVYSVLTGSR